MPARVPVITAMRQRGGCDNGGMTQRILITRRCRWNRPGPSIAPFHTRGAQVYICDIDEVALARARPGKCFGARSRPAAMSVAARRRAPVPWPMPCGAFGGLDVAWSTTPASAGPPAPCTSWIRPTRSCGAARESSTGTFDVTPAPCHPATALPPDAARSSTCPRTPAASAIPTAVRTRPRSGRYIGFDQDAGDGTGRAQHPRQRHRAPARWQESARTVFSRASAARAAPWRRKSASGSPTSRWKELVDPADIAQLAVVSASDAREIHFRPGAAHRRQHASAPERRCTTCSGNAHSVRTATACATSQHMAQSDPHPLLSIDPDYGKSHGLRPGFPRHGDRRAASARRWSPAGAHGAHRDAALPPLLPAPAQAPPARSLHRGEHGRRRALPAHRSR